MFVLFHYVVLEQFSLLFFLLCFNFASRSSNLLSGPMQDPGVQMHESMDRVPKDFERSGCPRLSVSELNLANSAVELKLALNFLWFWIIYQMESRILALTQRLISVLLFFFAGSSSPFSICMMNFLTGLHWF
jgi:hypothetical protein